MERETSSISDLDNQSGDLSTSNNGQSNNSILTTEENVDSEKKVDPVLWAQSEASVRILVEDLRQAKAKGKAGAFSNPLPDDKTINKLIEQTYHALANRAKYTVKAR